MSKSELEQMFVNLLNIYAPDLAPVREYRFALPRRFRFDFAWPSERVAVELEGGIWMRGRHVRGKGYEKDCEKYNLAALRGWRVLRFTRGMLERDPEGCVKLVCALVEGDNG